MGKQLLRIVFTPDNVTEPIVYRLGREFGLVTNIRRANVTKDEGWVLLDLQGEGEDIERAIEWAKEQGVTVEVVEGVTVD